MECAAMLHSYDALRQWTDFSLFENDQTFINREDSCEPNFSVETFPFESLNATYHSSSSSSSPMSSTSLSFDDFYPPPTFNSPSTKEQSPPLSDTLYSIPALYDFEVQAPVIKQERSLNTETSTSKPVSSPKTPKRKTSSKVIKTKAPASPSAIERRRQQNRASQMAFRERTKKLVEDLRKQLATSEAERLRLRGMLERVLAPDAQIPRYL